MQKAAASGPNRAPGNDNSSIRIYFISQWSQATQMLQRVALYVLRWALQTLLEVMMEMTSARPYVWGE